MPDRVLTPEVDVRLLTDAQIDDTYRDGKVVTHCALLDDRFARIELEAALRAQLAAREARIERLVGLLKLLEWAGMADAYAEESWAVCPACGGAPDAGPWAAVGHKPDCALAAALAEGPC